MQDQNQEYTLVQVLVSQLQGNYFIPFFFYDIVRYCDGLLATYKLYVFIYDIIR